MDRRFSKEKVEYIRQVFARVYARMQRAYELYKGESRKRRLGAYLKWGCV